MEDDRGVFFYMYIGTNRTGKSLTARISGNLWSITNPNRVIAGYDPQRRFKHLIDPRYQLSAGEKGWWYGNEERASLGRRPLEELRNALVILDDMRGLNPWNQASPDLMRLMEFRAEYMIDIIMIVHAPGFVLTALSMYVSNWFIFYTKGKDDKFEDKIDNYEECTRAAEIMKSYVHAYPSIVKNPKQFVDESGHGRHRFPHIIVDTDTGELIPQNINFEWLKEELMKYKN